VKRSSRSPLPKRIARRAAAGSFRHGVRSEKPIALPRAPIIRSRHDFEPPCQGARAPASSERSGSAISLSGSTPIRLPSPEQAGQAPYGLLNEKRRGVISASPVPQRAQA